MIAEVFLLMLILSAVIMIALAHLQQEILNQHGCAVVSNPDVVCITLNSFS